MKDEALKIKEVMKELASISDRLESNMCKEYIKRANDELKELVEIITDWQS